VISLTIVTKNNILYWCRSRHSLKFTRTNISCVNISLHVHW